MIIQQLPDNIHFIYSTLCRCVFEHRLSPHSSRSQCNDTTTPHRWVHSFSALYDCSRILSSPPSVVCACAFTPPRTLNRLTLDLYVSLSLSHPICVHALAHPPREKLLRTCILVSYRFAMRVDAPPRPTVHTGSLSTLCLSPSAYVSKLASSMHHHPSGSSNTKTGNKTMTMHNKEPTSRTTTVGRILQRPL